MKCGGEDKRATISGKCCDAEQDTHAYIDTSRLEVNFFHIHHVFHPEVTSLLHYVFGRFDDES